MLSLLIRRRRLAKGMADLLRRVMSLELGLFLPTGFLEIREEQSKALRLASWVFAALGFSTITVVVIDFSHELGALGWSVAAIILAVYALWLILALRSTGTARFMRGSVLILAVQGLLWAWMIRNLAVSASPAQTNFVTALIMALVSTPLLSSPFSMAMAFWLPVAVGGMVGLRTLRPVDNYMALCFAGYLGFTLVCIIVLNRTLLERSVVRTRLHRQNETVRLLLRDYEENAADWLWETDDFLRLREVTARFAQVLGVPPKQASGLDLAELLMLQRPTVADAATLKQALKRRTSFGDLAIPLQIAGEQRWWLLSGRPVINALDEFIGYRGVGSDVTEAKRSEEMSRYLATHDSLSGLGNRRMFIDELDLACNAGLSGRSSGSRRPFSLLMMDLDRFKEVNDDYGHEAGDAVLVAIADRIRAIVRDGDVVSRLGGDEFAILLRSADDMEAIAIAERVITTAKERIKVGDTWLGVGVSVGVAAFPRDGATPKDIMRSADLALYRAKDAERGSYRVFDPTFSEDFHDRVTLLAELRITLAENGLSLHYQPIVDLHTGRVVAMEALSRWHHPQRGMVPPSTFIPLAEDNGLIASLGRNVLMEACRAAAKWDPEISVSVNLSPIQFRDPALPDTIASALQSSGLHPSRLDLEITESAWLGGNNQTSSQLSRLHELGVKVVMDDFGTGFSSLSSLRTFVFDGMKVDAQFIRDIEKDVKAHAIIRLIAGLTAELGITLTAEGIETEGQLTAVRDLGIQRVQGYLLGRPSLTPSNVAVALLSPADTSYH